MKKFRLILAMTGILLAQTVISQTGEKNFIDQNYIEVTGKAEMEIVPDEIYLKIVLNENDNKGKISLSEMEQSLYQVLVRCGIDTKEALYVRDAGSTFKVSKWKRSDIRTSRQYVLLVTDAPKVGEVISGLQNVGIANVSVERVSHSRIEDLQKEVKTNAIKAAKEKAAMLTQAIGQDIGRALYIYEHPSYITPRIAQSNVMFETVEIADEEEGNGFIPSAEFEKIKLEYSITVRFELY